MRFHLSCLKLSDAECSFYSANGDSTQKCETCVKKSQTEVSENTPVRSLRSTSVSEIGGKMASPARELAPRLKGNKSLSAQLEAVRLNGVHTISMIENYGDHPSRLSRDSPENLHQILRPVFCMKSPENFLFHNIFNHFKFYNIDIIPFLC
jgi:hypothetical protein